MKVAIKSINIYDKSKRKQFKNDLKVLFENNCKHLVNFYGAFFEEGSVKLVLEYMNLGSLDKIISKLKSTPQPCTPEDVLRKITKDVRDIFYFY
jgi:serine/threonine protein kinase